MINHIIYYVIENLSHHLLYVHQQQKILRKDYGHMTMEIFS